MDKEYFVDLTTRVYNLTLLFPKKESLRYQIRELANDILANFISILEGNIKNPKDLLSETEQKLEIFDGFLKVAKAQNWVSPKDILEVQREYSKIRKEIEKFNQFQKKEIEKKTIQKEEESPSLSLEEEFSLNERQEKILDILKQRDKIQVQHVKEIFPEISKRTLRRDFESLLKQGLVKRIGERSNTFYKLSGRAEERTSMS
ncbi:DeoR family transcriptional regulator [Patescibacteria group bacterium]|nr:DeoR family transcriptional regulator [Patescibacteria group bacterium]